MSAFATGDDLRARWSLAPEGDEADAVLEDASVWLQAVYDLPDDPSEKLLSVLRMIVCSMTKGFSCRRIMIMFRRWRRRQGRLPTAPRFATVRGIFSHEGGAGNAGKDA